MNFVIHSNYYYKENQLKKSSILIHEEIVALADNILKMHIYKTTQKFTI